MWTPPPPTCQFQAFRSVCNTIGLRSFPPFDAKEFNKARWYVLHNSPEIDTYRAQFQSLFPEKNMLEEFPSWFRTLICERHVNNLQDPEVSTTSELFALANGPSRTPMSVNACVVDGVRYVVQSRDERRTTQNSGICAPGPDGEMSYGQLQEILEFKYLSFKVALFRVKWFDTRNNGRVKKLTFRNGMTQIIGSGEWWKNDQYILATQVKQVFYLEDPAKPNVKVVEHVNHKKFFNRGVIVVENEPDIIHLDNSSDLPPSTSGNDLDNVTFYIDLHIDGESTEVDAPPDIIDVPGEDDDISDDEDPLPHDLADSDVEDLINDDDAHGRDGGGEDPSRPPPPSFGCAGCFVNRGKGKRKPNLGGVKAGRKTRERTRNQQLKDAVAANKGRPIEIGFEDRVDNTVRSNEYDYHDEHYENDEGSRFFHWYDSGGASGSGGSRSAVIVKAEEDGDDMGVRMVVDDTPWTVKPSREPRTSQGRERAKSTAEGGDGEAAGSRLQHRVGVLSGRARDVLILPPPPLPQCTHNSGDVEKLKKKNKYLTKQVNLMMKLFRSDDKFSQMLTQYESTPEFGSGSGGCGDDEIADDEDGGEDEEDEEDGDS
ncbi:hypothetical protein Tco_0336912 [Tanacetum coccineum]